MVRIHKLHMPYFSTSEEHVISELYDKNRSHNRNLVAEAADGSTGKGRQLWNGGRASSGCGQMRACALPPRAIGSE